MKAQTKTKQTLLDDLQKDLPKQDMKKIKRLSDFEAPFLKEKLLMEGKVEDEKEYKKHLKEFKKYIALNMLEDKILGMTNEKVDDVWHQFILFTKPYQNFCKNIVGTFLHHSPNISSSEGVKEDTENMIETYREYFGDAPEDWRFEEIEDSWCNSGCSSCGGCGSNTKDASACAAGCAGCNGCNSCT